MKLSEMLDEFWKTHVSNAWGIDTHLLYIGDALVFKATITYEGRVVFAAHSDFIPKNPLSLNESEKQALTRLLTYPVSSDTAA